MNIFVFEHVVGGGLVRQRLLPGLQREGAAMLAAAVWDFQNAGHHVLTTLDQRVQLDLDEALITRIGHDVDLQASFDELATQADATLVIAPETDGVLRDYVVRLERQGHRHLGCSPQAIDQCADKLGLSRTLAEAGMATPPTDVSPDAFDFPLVVKPRTGAGCEHTFVVRNRAQLETLPRGGDRIFQPYVPGRAASASFIVHHGDIQPLLVGDQILTADHKISYAGGRVPIEPQLAERANRLAYQAIKTVTGLRGFVGVDVVLGDTADHDQVIEINPRVTVSFVAIRHLCYPPLAQVLLEPAVPLLFADDRVLAFDPTGVITENPGR